jgi:hypothetical protein
MSAHLLDLASFLAGAALVLAIILAGLAARARRWTP